MGYSKEQMITIAESGLKNYLNKHNIHKDDSDMQTIIINSFYNQHKYNADNNAKWSEKIAHCQRYFGSFSHYVMTEWKK